VQRFSASHTFWPAPQPPMHGQQAFTNPPAGVWVPVVSPYPFPTSVSPAGFPILSDPMSVAMNPSSSFFQPPPSCLNVPNHLIFHPFPPAPFPQPIPSTTTTTSPNDDDKNGSSSDEDEEDEESSNSESEGEEKTESGRPQYGKGKKKCHIHATECKWITEKGLCTRQSCDFTHPFSKTICRYAVKGGCTNSNCAYQHPHNAYIAERVKVLTNARNTSGYYNCGIAMNSTGFNKKKKKKKDTYR